MPDPDTPDPLTISRSLVVPPSEVALRPATTLLPGIVDQETERADSYARAARSTNTHRAYMTDWEIFTGWCAERSELVALTLGDIAIVPEGLRITIGRSKTDQAQEGVVIAVPGGLRLRPKERLLGWIEAVKVLEAGVDRSDEEWAAMPLFRRLTRQDTLTDDLMSDRAVARLVQSGARKAGLDERKFAGHSLRAGFLTESAARGATIFKMQEVSRHKSVQVLSEYVRSAELFKDHAGAGFL